MSDLSSYIGNADAFPVLKHWHFFNHAGVSPLPKLVADAMRKFATEGEAGAYLATTWYPDIEKLRLEKGKRYKLFFDNKATGDIHPLHLHRHTFEVVEVGGKPMAGLMKDVVSVGSRNTAAVSFVADNPGLTLFHCHQQLHMDFGFMTLFDYSQAA